MLRGARLVTASETEEGRAWAEARIKAMTGGDPITARFMRQDYFTFQPQFKLTIIGNHKPVLSNVDDAARRRFNMVPFLYKPPAKDKELEAKLLKEAPGILRWMIEGCLDWQKNGLIQPDVVIQGNCRIFLRAGHRPSVGGGLLRHWRNTIRHSRRPIQKLERLRTGKWRKARNHEMVFSDPRQAGMRSRQEHARQSWKARVQGYQHPASRHARLDPIQLRWGRWGTSGHVTSMYATHARAHVCNTTSKPAPICPICPARCATKTLSRAD